MTGVKRRNTVATAAVPEKVRALRREFSRFCCLELEWGLGFCGEGKEGGEMISHLMEEARGLTVARCFLREEKMVVLRGALVTRLVDAVKDMALGRGIWRGRTRNGCSQVDNGSSKVIPCNYHYRVQGSSSDSNKVEQEEEYKVLTAVKSQYNDILIVDTPKTRMLLLDSTHNVHSLLYKDGQKWTRSYWDEFASLPAIIPQGPVAIFGLGGGTAAHLMLDVWPSLQLEGWEIDEILINKARDYFGLLDLEKQTQAGGILHVVVGDALCSLEDNGRKYAGIVIDLFYGGKVLPQLQEVATWLEMKGRLIPNGRLMVNCGGIEESDAINERSTKSVDNAWVENQTIKVLCEAFPGQLSWKRVPESEGANYLALTGPLPDLTSWSAMVPDHLSATVSKWRPCSPLP
ncbi:hypothetical protein POTOM_000554 [Populus tomentosa]|uniref:S-adenosyl-L-methionine-dependent methyltransferases superfamily protein n=1 Tax=Populus tomentosa TaxID=118781 RepID=A0A8X8DGB2_POPTO|nr:hypothetical protein POTOM_000554 [Populus tomentosa]